MLFLKHFYLFIKLWLVQERHSLLLMLLATIQHHHRHHA